MMSLVNELWMLWIAQPIELRALLFLPPLTLALGALVLVLCRAHPETGRLAWPVILVLHLGALAGIWWMAPDGLALLPALTPHDVPAAVVSASHLPVVVGAWLSVAALLWLRTLVAVLRLSHRITRVETPAPARIAERVQMLSARVGTRPPPVVLAGDLGPACVGPLRPRLVLPQAALQWPEARLDAVLAHELVHAARGDAALLLLIEVLGALLWFIPGTSAVSRDWRRALEASCDDDALLLVPHRDDYADALLQQARELQRPNWLAAVAASAVGRRVRRVLAGVGHEDFATARVYWPLVLSAALVVPVVLAVPEEAHTRVLLPDTRHVESAVTREADDSKLIWLDLADASGPRLWMPQMRAAGPDAGAAQTCTQGPLRLPPGAPAMGLNGRPPPIHI